MSKRGRVLIFGIDGATFQLVKPWMASGELPNLARVARDGVTGELRSTLPPNSPTAWSSFMTGMNPGKHGVYGFSRVEPEEGYAIRVNSGSARRMPSVWQLLSQAGRRSIVLNVPMTYPPQPIDGIVVTGIDTPALESQFTYPAEFRHEVLDVVPDYVLDVHNWGVEAEGERRKLLFEDIMRMVESRRQLALHLMATQVWDLFTVVFTATDRAMHFFWRFLDPAHPLYDAAEAPKYHDAILRVYKEVDQALGEMLATLDDETTLIVMSDHGFGPQLKLLRINQWLLESGFLHLTSGGEHGFTSHISSRAQVWMSYSLGKVVGLMRANLSSTAKARLKRLFPQLRERVGSQILFTGVDWSRTKAYHTAEFPGSIRVNMKGREVKGSVEPGAEYDEVCATIQNALEAYIDPQTGQRIVERVFRRDDLYRGPFKETAPDLIVHLADYSYTIDWFLPTDPGWAQGHVPVIDALAGAFASNCGSHRQDGILMLYGNAVRQGIQIDDATIYDVVPTALYLMGLAVPSNMDGEVLTAAIKPDILDQRSVERGTATSPLGKLAYAHSYTEEDAQAVAERLNDLGYL